MANEHDRTDRPLVALQHGSVTRNDDPMKLGRVKVRVPGRFEPESRWAFPLATLGGGSKNRGFFSVPEVGAEVALWCCQGDPDFVFYAAGHWGAPGGVPDSPSFVHAGDVTPEEAPELHGFESSRFVMLFDDRTGRESFEIRDKDTGNGIAYDGLTRTMQLRATTAIVIKADGAVQIDGLAVTIAGRPVIPGSGPI